MTTVYLMPTYGAGWQGLDASGNPLNGGKLYTYQAGTSTPFVTYTTNGGNVANSNPIILNADGRPPSEIWLQANISYKVVLQDSSGNTIETRDNLPGINDFSAIQNGSIFALGNVTGTNTITATGSPTVTSLTTGQLFLLNPANTTTSTGTLQVDSTSAKNIFAYGALATGGELKIAIPALIEYDGTQQNILNPQPIVGTFTATLTGCTTSPTYIANYTKIGNSITLELAKGTTITGTSNATTKTLTGMPAFLWPTTTVNFTCATKDNGGTVSIATGQIIGGTGVISLFKDLVGTAFTSSGAFSCNSFDVPYTTA